MTKQAKNKSKVIRWCCTLGWKKTNDSEEPTKSI